jgi:hypothetical protein
VTESYDPKIIKRLRQKTERADSGSDLHYDHKNWLTTDVTDLSEFLPKDSLLRAAIEDSLAIQSFKLAGDHAAALRELIERGKKKQPVAREYFALALAHHLLFEFPPVEDKSGKSLETLLRERLVVDSHLVDGAEKVMKTMVAEPGERRNSLLATIASRRSGSQVTKDHITILEFKRAPDRPKAFRELLQRIENTDPAAREDYAIRMAYALLSRGKGEHEYIDYAEQVIKTFIKEPRPSMLESIRVNREYADSLKKSPPVPPKP